MAGSAQLRFRALPREPAALNDIRLVVVDIGYSSRKRSCGIAEENEDGTVGPEHEFTFGRTVEFLLDHLQAGGSARRRSRVLVLEAPLSTRHDEKGNPATRGQFEVGRGWYHGPGAVATLAAARLLEVLGMSLPQ